MATITIEKIGNLQKTHFVDINELKVFIYESFGYPDINSDLEEKWYKNGKLDLCEETFSSVKEMKNLYINLKK
ncbi:MAG: hypothetical protein AB7E37_03005 [Candidatus Altimarinota bacterium]